MELSFIFDTNDFLRSPQYVKRHMDTPEKQEYYGFKVAHEWSWLWFCLEIIIS